jgi:phenylpyruvate tautomerase PptA (4-oxalocrotonate tautomerase family)
MPYYEVNHACTLTESQKGDLASAITRTHSTKFSTPSMFVNVKFTDIKDTPFYIGGKHRTRSHILAHVRSGPSRTQRHWTELCNELTTIWDGIVPLPKVKRSAPDEDKRLYSVFVLGDITAGMEAGFSIPEAGGDVAWLHANMEAFKQRAESGEEDFVDLVKEVEERGLLNGQKSAQQSLEEALGWGDSA